MPKAVIFGLSGPALTPAESRFFKAQDPLGFILFARNAPDPVRLHALTDALRTLVGRDCPILIDQEGGRVQRLGPPHWPAWPAAQVFGDLMLQSPEKAIKLLRLSTRQIAETLKESGITVNCAPVLDVLRPETHGVIGNRSFGDDPGLVATLGAVVCETFLEAGIRPIIKHIPGHGRAKSDSHHELPVVDAPLERLEAGDFSPFRALSEKPYAPLLWAMTAHVIYAAFDPARPATLSGTVISRAIRGSIGFPGLLLSDDLAMKALDPYGDMGERAQSAIEAGCDVALHCSGEREDMARIAERVPDLPSPMPVSLRSLSASVNLASSRGPGTLPAQKDRTV